MLTLLINLVLILAASSLASFLGVRVWINRKLRPNPEDLPELKISKESPLYKNFYDLLDQAPSDKHSMFYPLSPLQDALLERIKLADQAVGTIEAQYYMLNDDEAGDIFLQTLTDAAQRGVQVRLLIDDLDVIQREDVLIRLVDEFPNFQIRVFNAAWLRLIRKPEFLVRFPRLSRRMHNKSYTIDGIFSIIGGRNIGNEYFDLKHELTFADFDILFAGPMVQGVRKEFDTYWYSGLCSDIHSLGTAADDEKYAKWRNKLSATYAQYLPILMKDRDQVLPALKQGKIEPYYAEVRVIYDAPDKILTSVFKPDSRMMQEIEGL
ncbi:MAG TPA: phospholipase D-like domain-containing protein, partial [Thiolinea sp.]|nr:phospholipase D-like domain-containing protein [Thiolinea sp.]